MFPRSLEGNPKKKQVMKKILQVVVNLMVNNPSKTLYSSPYEMILNDD